VLWKIDTNESNDKTRTRTINNKNITARVGRGGDDTQKRKR